MVLKHLLLAGLSLLGIEANSACIKKFRPKTIAVGAWNPIKSDKTHPKIDPQISCAIHSCFHKSSAFSTDGTNCYHGIVENILMDPSSELGGVSISVDSSKIKSEIHIFTFAAQAGTAISQYHLDTEEMAIGPVPHYPNQPAQDGLLIGRTWGLVSCDRGSKECFSWKIGASHWDPYSPMLFEHLHHGIMGTEIDGKFYLMSGKGSQNFYGHGNTEYLHPNDSWIQGPNIPEGIYQFGFAGLSKDEIIVFGGYRQGLISDQMAIFNLESGDLLDIGQLPSARRSSTCSSLILVNGTEVVICLGGAFPNGDTTNEVVLIDKATRHWEIMTDWALPSAALLVPIVWNKIDRLMYIIGGKFKNDNATSVFKFNELGLTHWQRLTDNFQEGFSASIEVSYIVS